MAARALAELALAFGATFAHAPGTPWEPGTNGLEPIPALKQRVTDLTGTLAPADAQALDAKLAGIEEKPAASGSPLSTTEMIWSTPALMPCANWFWRNAARWSRR